MKKAEEAVPTFEAEVEAGAQEGATSASDVFGEIGEVAEQVISALGNSVGDAEDSVREGLVQAEATIRKHPLTALGVAAGVGFLVGVLVSRGRE